MIPSSTVRVLCALMLLAGCGGSAAEPSAQTTNETSGGESAAGGLTVTIDSSGEATIEGAAVDDATIEARARSLGSDTGRVLVAFGSPASEARSLQVSEVMRRAGVRFLFVTMSEPQPEASN